MKIFLRKLRSYYDNIGEKVNGEGIAELIGLSSLYYMPLFDIAKYLKSKMSLNTPSIISIKKYMKGGLSTICLWDNIILKPEKDFYYVVEGNHRILALILLNKKYINVNKKILYISTPFNKI